MYFKKSSSIPFTGDVVGNVNGTVKDGKRDGPWIEKRENGNIHSKTNYKKGIKEGLREEYHDNSLLAEIATYKNGLLSGKYKSFHINFEN